MAYPYSGTRQTQSSQRGKQKVVKEALQFFCSAFLPHSFLHGMPSFKFLMASLRSGISFPILVVKKTTKGVFFGGGSKAHHNKK